MKKLILIAAIAAMFAVTSCGTTVPAETVSDTTLVVTVISVDSLSVDSTKTM